MDDNGVLSSASRSTNKGDTELHRLDCNVDKVTLLTSLSSLAETTASDILEKKVHARAEADSSSSSCSGLSSVGSTRSSAHSSDVASQLDEDEEEIFEDASSVLPDGMGQPDKHMDTHKHTCIHMQLHTYAPSRARICDFLIAGVKMVSVNRLLCIWYLILYSILKLSLFRCG